MSWEVLPTDAQAESNFDNYMEKLAVPMAEPPKPMEQTVLKDIAAESEAPKTYVAQEGEERPFEKRKQEGFSMAPPVDVYEPGFRSDVYEGLLKFFRDRRETKDRIQRLREKIGLRG